MPTASVLGADLHYLDSGDGPDAVVLGHGYLMTSALWDPLVPALVAAGYRVVRADWRGQGPSETSAGGYDPWDLAADALALLDTLGVRRFHYVGHSMGGYVGWRLALRAPGRVASLVQIGTTSEAEAADALREYGVLLWALRLLGYGAVLGKVMPILYGPDFLADPARRSDVDEQRRRIRSNSRTGVFRAGRGIFDRDDVSAQLGRIRTPTLLVTGEHDRPHPPSQARADAGRLPHAELVVLDGVGHTPPAEVPDRVRELVLDWLSRHPLSAPHG